MISVKNLSKYYGTVQALDRITFNVGNGEILGLLGPNGAGKSTTMRILTCYLPPTSGAININGMDILENPVKIKRLMGYLPEFAPLYTDMLVYDYLKFVATIRDLQPDKKERRITEMVEICGLKDVIHRPFRELSRGFKQRVGIAHALMSDPEILILDEPTSGLDPNQIMEIRSIIREIGKKKTIIFSTHILSEAEATCDRIVIIDRGKIVADGTSESIKASALGRHLFQMSLLDASFSDVKGYLGRIDGVDEIRRVAADSPDELKVQFICSNDNRKEIYSHVRKKDWFLIEFTKEKGSLESIFRELTVSDQSAVKGKNRTPTGRKP